MRATADDPDTAELVGINAERVYAGATAIAVAIAALAGTVLRHALVVRPDAGPSQLIFAFEAVVIGGLGSLWGTLRRAGSSSASRRRSAPRSTRSGPILAGTLVFLAVLAFRRGGIFALGAGRA